MRLSRSGIVGDWRNPAWRAEGPDRPPHTAALLRYWHETIEAIDDDYTFGDFIALLQHVDDIAILSPLLACDVTAILGDADRPPKDDDEQPMQYVHVSNVAQLQTYEQDAAQPDEPLEWLDDEEAAKQDLLDDGVASLTHERAPFRLVDATSDDPLTGAPARRRMRAPVMHGSWKPPYQVRREFAGWGKCEEPYHGFFAAHPECDPEHYEGAFALDFTPLWTLLRLPLRYTPTVQFHDRLPSGTEALVFETQLTITFGEFAQAVFSEIGFHGSPDARDDAREMILARVAAIDRDRGGDRGHPKDPPPSSRAE